MKSDEFKVATGTILSPDELMKFRYEFSYTIPGYGSDGPVTGSDPEIHEARVWLQDDDGEVELSDEFYFKFEKKSVKVFKWIFDQIC